MWEKFEEIFEEVMEELDADWYEVFDGNMGIVEKRIIAKYGKDVIYSEEYDAWYDEMAEDL